VARLGSSVVTGSHTFRVASRWGITPRQSLEAECLIRGRAAVVDGCVRLLAGEEVDAELILALGGPHAEQVVRGRDGGPSGYWPRVWAVRGLLHVWDDSAAPGVVMATTDESWRVREMAAKVVARHDVADAFDSVLRLRDDPVARVRSAAHRALTLLTAHGA